MRHIIYVCIDNGNGEPSIYMLLHLPFHPLTLTISLLFPLTFPHHIPNIPIYSFSFPHFPLIPQSFSPFPTLLPSPYLHTLPSFPLTHPITAYNPHTLTLHPLPHVSPHPPTHVLLTTLYALVSTFSCCLTLSSCSTLPYVPRET